MKTTGAFEKYIIVTVAVAFALILLLSRLFSSEIYLVQSLYYLSIHATLELFSIVVAFSIALQSFVSYPFNKSDRKLFLGVIFFIIGALDLMHTLMYKGMPMSMGIGARATYFWIIARMTGGIGLTLYFANWIPKKRPFLIFSILYLLFMLVVIFKWGRVLPPMLTVDGEVTNLKVVTECVICSIYVLSIYFLRRSQKQGNSGGLSLTYALILLILGELIFALQKNTYDIVTLFGHVYNVSGYFFILQGLLVVHIKEPFQRIEMSLRKLNKIFQFAPVGLSILRKSDFKHIEVNNCFSQYLELKETDIFGKTPLELGFPQAQWTKIEDYLKSAPNDEISLDNLEISFTDEDGNTRFFIVNAEVIELDHEECILMSSTEITELKNLQVEMLRLDRLNLVGQMAAGIGHEIRNPMTTVRGYLQLMGEKSEYKGKKATIDFMIEELDRANLIITEFLSLAKTKKTNLEFQNLNNILSSLHPLIEADAFTQNKRICFFPNEISDIELNSNGIRQLILNLCRNGLEAMTEGGCLTIETYMKESNVVLAIKDQGTGIPEELLVKIGTPFFTTKENGTGLGLAICYRIAKSHNAKMDLKSNSNGTQFLISFPVKPVDINM